MYTKAGLSIVAILVIAGGWWFFTSRTAEAPSAENSAAAQTTDPSNTRATASLLVNESIAGTWQSIDDEKFVRTFSTLGTVTDSYEGTENASGTFTVFTAEDPLAVTFPLEPHALYIQIRMEDAPDEPLNFELSKLTPEELELIYMDRGGVLRFRAI